jgi:hypothetical protein
MAEKLVGILLAEASAPRVRPQLHVVGHPPAPEKPAKLADVIDFRSRTAPRHGRPATSSHRRSAAGI